MLATDPKQTTVTVADLVGEAESKEDHHAELEKTQCRHINEVAEVFDKGYGSVKSDQSNTSVVVDITLEESLTDVGNIEIEDDDNLDFEEGL